MCAWFVSLFAVLVLLSTQVAHANDVDNTSADNLGENKAIIELAPLLADKKTRSEALGRLTASAAPRARVWLDALLEGELYILKSDSSPVVAIRSGKKYLLTDAVTGSHAGTVSKSAIKKIKINNAIRGQLRSAIAALALRDTDPLVRRGAVERMLQSLNPSEVEAIKQQLPGEPDADVKELMALAVQLSDLDLSLIHISEPTRPY